MYNFYFPSTTKLLTDSRHWKTVRERETTGGGTGVTENTVAREYCCGDTIP